MDERAERVVRNEAVFREVNEQVEALSAMTSKHASFPIVCECGSLACAAPLRIEPAVYEAVRARPARFVVSPGHQIEDLEDVVERHETFIVVAKKPGATSALAEALDPRAPPPS